MYMSIGEMLDELAVKARKDPQLKKELLDTRKAANPLAAFCEKCCSCGYPVYDMDLLQAGEEAYAAMRRSTLSP